MSVVLVVHHCQDPVSSGVSFCPSFPFAAYESPGSVLAHACFVGQVPVVDVFAAAIAADISDATFVVVA